MKTMIAIKKIWIAGFISVSMLLCSFYPYENHKPAQEQEWPDTTLHVGQEVYVIQPSGISLKDTPHPLGKALAKLVYGEKLKISKLLNTKNNTVKDTVVGLKLSGYWIEVLHGPKKGYVFSTHVFERIATSNRKAVLLYATETCDANFRYDARLNYYGVYRTPTGTVMKKGMPSFYVERSISGIGDGHWFWTTFQALEPVDQTAELLFVAGLAQNLKEGKINELLLSEKQRTISGGTIKFLPEAALAIQASAGVVRIEQGRPARRQAIDLYDCQRLDWCGDLDGDGKLDFIFAAGDKGMGYSLYLSSLAKGNELVGYADSLFFPMCC